MTLDYGLAKEIYLGLAKEAISAIENGGVGSLSREMTEDLSKGIKFGLVYSDDIDDAQREYMEGGAEGVFRDITILGIRDGDRKFLEYGIKIGMFSSVEVTIRSKIFQVDSVLSDVRGSGIKGLAPHLAKEVYAALADGLISFREYVTAKKEYERKLALSESSELGKLERSLCSQELPVDTSKPLLWGPDECHMSQETDYDPPEVAPGVGIEEMGYVIGDDSDEGCEVMSPSDESEVIEEVETWYEFRGLATLIKEEVRARRETGKNS